MKIKFQDTSTGEILPGSGHNGLASWELNPSQEKFWDSKKKFVLFSGGYGCIAGETKLLNADTGEEVEIQDLGSPIRVFSHNGKKAWAMTPVRYAPAPLYELQTDSYNITCTREHSLLTPNGWLPLVDLAVGDTLVVSSPDLPHSTPESSLSILLSNVLHWIRILQDSLNGYRPVLHFYGGQPRLATGIAIEKPPPPADALGRIPGDSYVGARFFSKEHIHPYHESYLHSKSGSSPSWMHPHAANEANRTSSEVSGHASGRVPSSRKSPWMKVRNEVSRWIRNACGAQHVCSYPYPTMREEKIQSISYARTDYYYDLHILGTHSYYAQGFFSHNCGKSLMLTLKAIDLSLRYSDNYILMGRKTYPELRDSLIKEFFNTCPDALIKDYLKAEGRVLFHNKSEIIFRHLDTVSEAEIRSLNLGAAFIDQAEEIEEPIFNGIRGRLRRSSVPDEDKKIYMSTNPALTWLFAEFKQHPQPEYEVIEASTLENEKNLPPGYVADLLKYPEAYKKQFVYGIWDENLLSDRVVFAREYLDKLGACLEEPLRVKEGLDIFREYIPGHRYQMGIDASEGIVQQGVAPDKQKSDESVITIVDMTEEEEVASWSGRIPPDVVAEHAIKFAHWYASKGHPLLIIPEMNSIGLALMNRLNKAPSDYIRIYRREEFDIKTGVRSEKEGWRTTRQSKPLLVSHMQELLRLCNPKIHSRKTHAQFKSFVYTNEAKLSGMGAETGFHDDRVISLLLAFWEKGPVIPGTVTRSPVASGIIVRNGKLFIPQLKIEMPSSWKTN